MCYYSLVCMFCFKFRGNLSEINQKLFILNDRVHFKMTLLGGRKRQAHYFVAPGFEVWEGTA